MTSGLTADQLIETACEQTGLDDFGADTFRLGLDRLVDGLRDEARLNDVGEAMAPNDRAPGIAVIPRSARPKS
jgi:hypothetical protein